MALFALVACAVALSAIPAGESVPISSEGVVQQQELPFASDGSPLSSIHLSAPDSKGLRHFVDDFGRQRVFHGVNAVVKGPPWHPSTDSFDFETSLCDQDFAILREAGVNVIRLGVMWPGIEPARGLYNQSYISLMRDIARNASRFGIYTLVDMHQDVLSEEFCGEGAPQWAVKPSGSLQFPEPVGLHYTPDSATGLPTREDCAKKAWSDYYFSEAAGTAFQALYDNKEGLLDAWTQMWVTVAEAFKGETHILGLELINEPWAGDVVHDPLLLVPGHADKVNLQRVFDKLAQAIWETDADRLVFFSGVTWDDLGNGFSHAPGGRAERSVLSYHYYEYPYGPQLRNTSKSWVETQRQEARRLGVGAMLTEFDEPDGPFKSNFDATAEAAEEAGHSWACWEYKTFCKPPPPSSSSQEGLFGACKTGWGGAMWEGDGSVKADAYRHLARPFAAAVAGEAVSSALDPASDRFRFKFRPGPADSPKTDTLLRVPRVRYPGGAGVTVRHAGGAVSWGWVDASTLRVRVVVAPEPGTAVEVILERKS